MDLSQWLADRSALVAGIKQGVLIGLAVLSVTVPPGGRWSFRTAAPASQTLELPLSADFAGETLSPEARRIADWVARSRDNRSLAFAILDKRGARLYVFDPRARLAGASDVLLGAAPGDDSVAGIGHRPMAEVRPEERTTPAGRFVSEPGNNATGEDVIWVDYELAVSMHRVRIVDPKERRLERLASHVAEDRRISYGCINVPASFFDAVLKPLLGTARGVVYVLPERKSLQEVFPGSEM